MPLLWIVLVVATFAGCGGTGAHHTAYVTLPGSNQVIGYDVDNGSGKLTAIVGSPFTTGTSPSTVFVHPSKKFLYVANGGENTVSLFNVSSSGSLSEVTPRTPTGQQPLSLAIDAGGAFLFAGNVGSNNISVFSINSGSGALTEVTGSPFFSLSPSTIKIVGNFLYVANSNSSSVSAYSFSSAGALTPVAGSPFATGNSITLASNPSSMTADPAGHFLYVANLATSNFSVFSINSTSGALTAISGSPYVVTGPVTITITPPTTTPVALAVDPSGKYLYIASLNSNNIFGFSLDSSTGVPTPITGSPFTGPSGPVFITMDPGGKYTFVGNQTANNVALFTLNTSTGALTSSTTFSTGTAPTSMLIVQ
jgi:6-phosphogluconolactonase (cycloisomerase 2 family)